MKKIKQILLLGCDVSRSHSSILSNKEKYKRSDSMLVVLINEETGKVALVSFMRDIWVYFDGYGEDRINTAILKNGPKLAIKTINDYFNLNIDDYILLNMENFVYIVDELGGVDVNLTDEEAYYINQQIDDVKEIINYKGEAIQLDDSGLNHLNGLQTLTHVCDRYFGFCWKRGERQREVLKALMYKAKNHTSKSKMVLLGVKMLKYVKTSLSIFDVFSLAKVALKVNPSEVKTHCVPSEGTYEMVNDGIWHFEIDFVENSKQLQELINSL